MSGYVLKCANTVLCFVHTCRYSARQKYRPDIILYWRIEYRAERVLHPFCLTKSLTPLALCYNNIGPIFFDIGVGLNIGRCEQGIKPYDQFDQIDTPTVVPIRRFLKMMLLN